MSLCRECGTDVEWRKEQGCWQCFNVSDGKTHWDLCSKKKWQQVVATGERFDTPMQSGYLDSIRGTRLSREACLPVKGDRFKSSKECKQCVPPWEDCGTCPNIIPKEQRCTTLGSTPG
jgi:hypothetical protein